MIIVERKQNGVTNMDVIEEVFLLGELDATTKIDVKINSSYFAVTKKSMPMSIFEVTVISELPDDIGYLVEDSNNNVYLLGKNSKMQ